MSCPLTNYEGLTLRSPVRTVVVATSLLLMCRGQPRTAVLGLLIHSARYVLLFCNNDLWFICVSPFGLSDILMIYGGFQRHEQLSRMQWQTAGERCNKLLDLQSFSVLQYFKIMYYHYTRVKTGDQNPLSRDEGVMTTNIITAQLLSAPPGLSGNFSTNTTLFRALQCTFYRAIRYTNRTYVSRFHFNTFGVKKEVGSAYIVFYLCDRLCAV